MTNRSARKTSLAAQWAKEPTTILALPTGNKIVVKDPDLPDLALRGLIPNHLLPIVEKFIFDGKTAREQAADLSADATEDLPKGEKLIRFAEFMQYLDCFVVAASVDPVVTFDGKGGSVPVAVLSVDEKMHIWRWSAGLLAPLAEFPGDGTGPVVAVAELHDGEGDGDATE